MAAIARLFLIVRTVIPPQHRNLLARPYSFTLGAHAGGPQFKCALMPREEKLASVEDK
ncbi:hypothetical protein M2336_001808 [Sphingobium sp. B1D7B]|uniref:hypothetical protein n=1 Tax=unclassified Sphingobium TaxID=2611147 RepID=UPI002224ED2C|nr:MULTISPECIES: hypothetical protein [unclassified Sphingobium]MCW2405179.1 hypothetical protein [Sphingobium sp. B1D7B]MCW2416294.1 hypothetical protein [Sphingobium sp. B8D3A]